MNEQTMTTAPRPAGKRRRFNGVDAILILIILLVAAVLIGIFAPTSILNFFEGTEVNLEYTIEIQNVPTELAEGLSSGGYSLIDADGRYVLGNVVLVDAGTPYKVLSYNEDTGNALLTEYPGRCNVQITVSAKAIYTEGSGYTVNGRRIAVGEEIAVRCAGITGIGSCISMTQSN